MCHKFIVTGQVQGVFFRMSTRTVAISLGLHGHAINQSDGSVEVLACGETGAIDELETWLADGPPMASVTRVESIDVECVLPTQFLTGG
jgi:acylphosphatase